MVLLAAAPAPGDDAGELAVDYARAARVALAGVHLRPRRAEHARREGVEEITEPAHQSRDDLDVGHLQDPGIPPGLLDNRYRYILIDISNLH